MSIIDAFRLELKRMVNNYEVPHDESFFAPAEVSDTAMHPVVGQRHHVQLWQGDHLQMSTKLTVTEVACSTPVTLCVTAVGW